MLRINKITRGRFGNQILHYNTLTQLGKTYNMNVSCDDWIGNKYFKNLNINNNNLNIDNEITWDNLNIDNNNNYTIEQYCLHNVYYKVTKYDPRLFFELKDEYKIKLDKNITHIGIHMRGGDKKQKKRLNREIFPASYYINSIKYIEQNIKENKKYYLCTDDIKFDTYIKTLEYLKNNNFNYELGDINNYIYDFALLSECNILISSVSTFAVCAGFIGKQNKKIIHYNKWFDKTLKYDMGNGIENTNDWVKSFDDFWNYIYNHNNCPYYIIWKFLD